MAFKASPAGKGQLLVHGVEQFIERFIERKLKQARVDERIAELRAALKLPVKGAAAKSTPVPAAPKASAPKPTAPTASAPKPTAPKPPKKVAKKPAPKAAPAKKAAPADPLAALLSALDGHAKKAALIKAGKQKDQLLRSLIPLYVGQKLGVDISSGTTSKFWAKHGVKFAAPNAAKVLREQKGYATRSGSSVQITKNGVSYVEAALKK
jgi:hypothetical protein